MKKHKKQKQRKFFLPLNWLYGIQLVLFYIESVSISYKNIVTAPIKVEKIYFNAYNCHFYVNFNISFCLLLKY